MKVLILTAGLLVGSAVAIGICTICTSHYHEFRTKSYLTEEYIELEEERTYLRNNDPDNPRLKEIIVIQRKMRGDFQKSYQFETNVTRAHE